MSAKHGLWVVLALLILAAIGALYSVPWKEERLPGPPSAEARRQPYLAAARFLEHFNVPTHRQQTLQLLETLPPTDGLIVVGASLRGVGEARFDRLMTWVENGGSLLAVTQDVDGEGDPLLEALDVRLEAFDQTLPTAVAPLNEEAAVQELLEDLALTTGPCASGRPLAQVSFAGETRPLELSLPIDRRLQPGSLGVAYAAGGNAAGHQLVSVPQGLGRVYLITSLGLWRNERIGCHDHAHALRWFGEDRAGVWFLFDTQMPHIAQILWQRFPVAVGLALMLLLFWIWRGADRRRVEFLPEGPRRSLLEQSQGMARFYWQQGQEHELIDGLRRAALRGWPLQDADAQVAWLQAIAEHIDASPETLRWALFGDIKRDAREVRKVVRLLSLTQQIK